MLQIFVKQGVDLVLSGHDHSYQRFYPLKADVSDRHAVLFIVTGLAGTNPYFAKGNQYSARLVNNTDHFCVIKVTPKTLDITAYDNDNRVLDHVILSKEESAECVRSGMVWKAPDVGTVKLKNRR